MAPPTPIRLTDKQLRTIEQMAKRNGSPPTPRPQPAAVRTPTADAPTAAQPPKPEPRVIDGLEVDEQGQVVLTDEERALLGAVEPKPLDQQIGDLASRLYGTEMELAQQKQLLQHRSVQLVKLHRRIKDLESQRDTALAAANALAAPPTEDPTPEPEPAAD